MMLPAKAIIGVGGQVGLNFTHYKSQFIEDNAAIGFHVGVKGLFGEHQNIEQNKI